MWCHVTIFTQDHYSLLCSGAMCLSYLVSGRGWTITNTPSGLWTVKSFTPTRCTQQLAIQPEKSWNKKQPEILLDCCCDSQTKRSHRSTCTGLHVYGTASRHVVDNHQHHLTTTRLKQLYKQLSLLAKLIMLSCHKEGTTRRVYERANDPAMQTTACPLKTLCWAGSSL